MVRVVAYGLLSGHFPHHYPGHRLDISRTNLGVQTTVSFMTPSLYKYVQLQKGHCDRRSTPTKYPGSSTNGPDSQLEADFASRYNVSSPSKIQPLNNARDPLYDPRFPSRSRPYPFCQSLQANEGDGVR